MRPSTPRCSLLTLLLPIAIVAAAGCTSGPVWGTGEGPAPVANKPLSDYVARIRVESAAKGGGIKLNGFIVADLPGTVEVEVDQAGKVLQQYTISLSTNILDAAFGSVVIEPGEPAPGRIYFERARTLISDTAFVHSTK